MEDLKNNEVQRDSLYLQNQFSLKHFDAYIDDVLNLIRKEEKC